jgi:zinc resistance-associated protein
MMTGFRKNCLPLVLTLVLCLGFATMSWAGPRGMGGGGCEMGPGMGGGCGMGSGMGKGHGCGMMGMQMTPDQAAKAFDLRQKFMNDTADMRKQMMVKQAELGELWRAKDPDKAKVTAKQKEISALRDQLQEKGTAFKLDMRKEFPTMAGGPMLGGGRGQGACPMMGEGKGQGACPMVPPAPEGGKK